MSALAAAAIAGSVGQGDAPFGGFRAKRVIVVGMDGLAAWCVKENPSAMPTLSRLMREGAWTLESRSILPSSSACNWHSLFTCSASEQHGFNDWGTQKPVFEPSARRPTGLYPDVFAELRAQRPQAKIAYLYDWAGMAFVVDTNACDFVLGAPDAKLAKLAPRMIREDCPDLLAVIFHEPDGSGHVKGWGSPEYVASMRVLDGYLADIVAAIEESDEAGDTVLMVTSDHGGNAQKHGGATLREMERTLVLWGKNIRRNHHIVGSSAVYDTGATLAAFLGLKFPQSWIGRPMTNAIEDRQ